MKYLYSLNEGAALSEINSPNEFGTTLLMVAVANRHLSVVKVLIELGADPKQVDNWGKSALDRHIESGGSQTDGIGKLL